MVFQALHKPEIAKKIFEWYQKGESEQSIADKLNKELDVYVHQTDVSQVLNRPILKHEQNFIAANKNANEYFKKKIDVLANHILDSAQENQEKMEELTELVEQYIKDVEKKDKAKIGYINSIKGLSNSISRSLELQSKFVDSLQPRKVEVSNLNITNRVVQLLNQVNLCNKCKRKFADYLGKFQEKEED